MSQEFIKIRGARVHNLKNISLDIPKGKLVVITGLSGSGKSSLAFDTIYAEGQRRYVESLSAYARQFLGVMDKPDVDRIDGLSPAIAIDQRSVSKNPRSTVGTITEIYDYLRLLFARIGKPYCPKCNKVISRQSPSQIVDQILKLPNQEQVLILGPVVRGKKGEHRGIIEQVQKAGFVRVRIDGIVHRSQEALDLNLDKQKKHNIEIVVDQVTVPDKNNKDERARIVDSVETALKAGNGIVIISALDKANLSLSGNHAIPVPPKRDAALRSGHALSRATRDLLFSELFACDQCGLSLPEIEPRLFSFNSPFGACPDCQGLGTKLEIDPKMVIPNDRLTIAEGAIRPWANASHRVGRQGYYFWKLSQVAQEYGFSLNEPVKNLSPKVIDILLYGKGSFEGVISNLERRWKETESEFSRAEIEKYMLIKQCPTCAGHKLKPEALAVKIGNYDISQMSTLSITGLGKFLEELKLNETEIEISKLILKEILKRLKFLADVGLEYLTIGRESTTLSGGEAQRIRLATQIGSGLSGVVYILDEPSIGLHQRDLNKLIETLKQLRDLGNTVLVVEHDEQTILAADWVIDIGSGAGAHGGRVIFEGTSKQLISSKTLTGDYLSGRKKVEINVNKSQ
ncbi:MAG TPA: excinuclease ABC subunit UvrA, partial [Patescibacteria group bacterium]|nr:excinuclease ABC subunit UvrA [Patescibacteria group bacterium]